MPSSQALSVLFIESPAEGEFTRDFSYDCSGQAGANGVGKTLMRRLNTNPGRRGYGASGFSLIELVIVLAIAITICAIATINLVPAMQQERLTNAYNTTLEAMRLARGNAIAQRTWYSVTFANAVAPSPYATITVTPAAFPGAPNPVTYQLPADVSFLAQVGLPVAPAAVPDGYGAGVTAIDFGWLNGAGGGENVIFFCPDGSSQSAPGGGVACPGTWDGGVVYLARAGDLLSSRAVTLWGGTGRVRGWRLYNIAGVIQWRRQ